MKRSILTAALAAWLLAPPASAASAEESELVLLRKTVENLLGAMVEQGLLSREAAERLVADAQARADAEVAERRAAEAVKPGDVRVTYVPQTVVDDISERVSEDLGDEVTEQVVARAGQDGWGIPGALPEWVRNGRVSGDVRVRATPVSFDSMNAEYLNFQNINENGGAAGLDQNELFLNTTDDQRLYQFRMRLRAEFDPSEHVGIGLGFATDSGNPISRNVNEGTTGEAGFGIVLDEAWIRLNTGPDRRRNHVTFWGGRLPTLWQHSSMIWDPDLRLNGAVVEYDYANRVGSGGARGLFALAGVFPLQTVDARSEQFGVEDKWLYGGQLGYEFGLDSRGSRLSFAAAWYKFENYAGVFDDQPPEIDPDDPSVELPTKATDESVPEYIRKGNSLFPIRNTNVAERQIYGLAADFELVNVNGILTWVFAPDLELEFLADYVVNVGYDEDEIRARTGVQIDEQNAGYRFQLAAGNPDIADAWDWNVFGGWSYLERDAVIDGFTESNFRAGGTDHEGYFVGANLGIARNTWLRSRYLSFDEIDGPRLGIDIFQLELNARF